MPSALAAGPSSPAACRRGALLSVRTGPCRPRSALSPPRGVAAWAGRGRPAARPRADAAAHSRGAHVGPVSAPVGLPVAAASSQSRGRAEAVGRSGSRGRGPRLRPSHLSREGVAPATFLPPRAPAPGPRPRRQRAWRGGHAGPLCAGISRSSPTWCTRWPERATSWTRPTRTSWPAAATPRRAFCRKRRSFL